MIPLIIVCAVLWAMSLGVAWAMGAFFGARAATREAKEAIDEYMKDAKP